MDVNGTNWNYIKAKDASDSEDSFSEGEVTPAGAESNFDGQRLLKFYGDSDDYKHIKLNGIKILEGDV